MRRTRAREGAEGRATTALPSATSRRGERMRLFRAPLPLSRPSLRMRLRTHARTHAPAPRSPCSHAAPCAHAPAGVLRRRRATPVALISTSSATAPTRTSSVTCAARSAPSSLPRGNARPPLRSPSPHSLRILPPNPPDPPQIGHLKFKCRLAAGGGGGGGFGGGGFGGGGGGGACHGCGEFGHRVAEVCVCARACERVSERERERGREGQRERGFTQPLNAQVCPNDPVNSSSLSLCLSLSLCVCVCVNSLAKCPYGGGGGGGGGGGKECYECGQVRMRARAMLARTC